MIVIDEAQVRERLAWPPLIDIIEELFRKGCEVPVRHHHAITVPDQPDGTLLLMPAWQTGGYMGIKLLNVFPGNSGRGLPAVSATFVLFDGETGEVLASIDGGELTARRTAAASALASRYLSRRDASLLLMVGTGRLSTNLVFAHATVRPIRTVLVHGRTPEKAETIARQVRAGGLEARLVEDLAEAAGKADVISCATLSPEPLIMGDWLRSGVHLDLVGAYTPDMRESDDAALARADSIFVDTMEGAMAEAGDVLQPLGRGVISEGDIRGDLFALTRGLADGRQSDDEITLFKSVGTSIEDLAGAILAYEASKP
jgi:ornithine cyclodeaminase